MGDPVSHSLSPRLHNAAFAALGLDYVYVPLPVRAADVGAAVKGLAALGLRGANVTIPHKGAVVPFLDELSEDARLVEAVNTIVVEGERLRGYNTDVEGVRGALAAAAGDALRGEPALVLGAGGAARAAALALSRLGCPLTVVNRTPAKAERLAALITAGVPGARCAWLPLSALTERDVTRQRVVVNATSLGMTGEGKVPALLADNVTAGQVVFDAVYASAPTDFLVAAQARGATVIDGLTMLLGQAAEAFSLWTGVPAPLEVMRDAVQR
ncbi:MAG TPA: shikimate dehydrogenase [Thermoleophilia bacterium]|nr:shikimate dehydrogenase [Thermoleophilia bacterium]